MARLLRTFSAERPSWRNIHHGVVDLLAETLYTCHLCRRDFKSLARCAFYCHACKKERPKEIKAIQTARRKT